MIYGQRFLELSEEFKDLSLEDVQSLSEFCKSLNISYEEEFLSESSLMSICEAAGIDGSKIREKSSKTGEKVGKVIKEKGITEQSKKDIKRILDDAIEDIRGSIDDIVVPKSIQKKIEAGEVDTYKIQKSILLFILVYCINTIVSMALSVVVGRTVARYLGAVLCAPIVEETAKAIAIKGKYDKEFMILFNVAEFSMYVNAFRDSHNIIPIRIVCVGFHYTTAIIQKLTSDEKIQEKLGYTKDDKEQLTFLGRLIGMLLHACWNAGGGVLVVKGLGLI